MHCKILKFSTKQIVFKASLGFKEPALKGGWGSIFVLIFKERFNKTYFFNIHDFFLFLFTTEYLAYFAKEWIATTHTTHNIRQILSKY